MSNDRMAVLPKSVGNLDTSMFMNKITAALDTVMIKLSVGL